MNNNNTGLFQKSEVNIKEMLSKYLQYWYLFLAGVLICGVAAFFHLRYKVVPQYYISSTLLIKDNGNEGVLPTGFSAGMMDAGKTLGSEMIILRSQNLMERVFGELGFNTTYYFEGRVRDVEVFEGDLPVSLVISHLAPEAYGKAVKISYLDNNNFNLIEYGEGGKEIATPYKFGQQINLSFGSFTVIGSPELQFSRDIIVVFHDYKKLAEKYTYLLTVSMESKDANVLRLGLSDPIPQRGVMILNKLVEVYNQEAIEDKKQIDLSTIGFLDERIAFLSTELSDVERDVEQYKQLNNLTDVSSNAQLYLQSASEYNREVENFELQLEIINSLEDYVGQEDLRLVPSSLNIQDPTLNGLIAKFNELQLERQRMLRTIQPSSSLIQNLNDQLLNLRENIRENLKNIKNGMMITRDNLLSSSSQFQSKIRQVPAIERELMEINRQQGIKHSIYLFLLQRREEAGLSLASTVSNSRIIDAAKATGPFNNNSSTIYLAALSLGLLIPFAFIYLKDVLNDKVTARKDVEEVTQTPILGEIFHSESKDTLQITEGNHSVIAETFRLVRANLHFANLGKENKVILVTSSRSGEGKTFCSINLGATLALSGKKVVIVDFDLRNGKMMEYLGIKAPQGLTDYLVSSSLETDSLLTSLPEVDGLYAIAAGTIPPNPAELITSPKIHELIQLLRSQFDYVLLDSPPIGQVADAYSLSSFVDSTLYIVRYNYSYKEQLSIVDEVYRNKKLNQPMVVLNDAKKGSGLGYGYGYGYGYGATNGEIVKGKQGKLSAK